MSAAAGPAVAGTLKGAMSAQSTANAAAAATRVTQTQTQTAIAAAASSNATLTKSANALKAAIAAQAAAARAASSFNGLGVGALQVATSSCSTCLDTTWTGADQPTETVNADGTYDVTVNQTQSRAVLSWETFNVGSKTTLTFDQQDNSNWIVLNRVVGDSASPSQILGTIKADGTVLVINQNGIIFGAGAQINVHSLIASTLEVGRNYNTSSSRYTQLSLADRNAEFLEYGLTGYAETNLTSSMTLIVYPTFSGTTDGTAHADAEITVEQGAAITASDGGLILLAAPSVTNAGSLSAEDGQVSLIGAVAGTSRYQTSSGTYFTVASQAVTLVENDGSDESNDPYVRGYLVLGGGGTVINTATGVIEADRGYISLGGYGSDLTSGSGTTTNAGILAATTAVSANGTIDLMGSTITLGAGSIILINADDNEETITQDADSIASFKTSQVRIGTYSSTVTMEGGAMIVAPSGDVTIGDPSGDTLYAASGQTGTITIGSGAVIDVSGLKDVLIPVSAYNLEIDLYGNELADSGGYQDSFLYGETVWIDARQSGVREDGVAWIGSPLLSVAAYYEAVGVTAAQLMTTGGNVTLGTTGAINGASAASSSRVEVSSGATIDISGGWVTYAAGTITTTKLVTSSGAVVDIGAADPLTDTYVAIYSGASRVHERWDVTDTYNSFEISTGSQEVESYTEGRDAGTLTIKSALVVYEGSLNADAYAGLWQIAASEAGTASSDVYGDARTLQEVTTQLPSGGLLLIQQVGEVGDYATLMGGGGDIMVVAAADYAREDGVTVLSDSLLSNSGLAQVSLWSSGAISVASDATVSLEAGGGFDAYAGRAITINGTISVPSGSIVLETADFNLNGSMFTTSDDTLAVGSFDITVTGTLSVAGLWVNDYGKNAVEQDGDAWLDGGSITIVSAASVSNYSTSTVANILNALTEDITATDVSGSIYLQDAQLIDLSGGGRVTVGGELDLTGAGGSLALINQTAFYQIESDYGEKVVGTAYGMVSGFRVHHTTGSTTDEVSINPDEITSTVQFNPDVIKAAGFAGGGTFTLWAPDVAFGSGSDDDTALATVLPLSFFQAGFSSYAITSYKTLLSDNTFVSSGGSSLGGTNAILQTQTFYVRSGETLTLIQAVLPTILGESARAALLGLETGGDVTSVLTASVPTESWDQLAVDLTLDGMVELVVEAGGTITAAPGATLTVAKLLNQGTIRLPGGTIIQSQTLPEIFSTDSTTTTYGVRALSDIFTVEADGSIVETKTSQAEDGTTNAEIAYNSLVYLLGELEAEDGIVLAAGSVTDLSGVSVVNPYTTVAGTRTGTIYAGGTLALASESVVEDSGFYRSSALSTSTLEIGSTVPARTLTIAAGAALDLDGAADTYTQSSASGGASLAAAVGGGGTLVSTAVWSDAGAISAPNGFTISSDSSLSAHAGSASAEGGILELADVILAQSVAAAAGQLAADQITAAGFTTLAVLGSLSSVGDVTLDLGKALYLASRPYSGTLTAQNSLSSNDYAVVISAGGDLAITAPYIGLLSSSNVLGTTTTGTAADHGVTLTATQAFDVAGAVLFDTSIADITLVSGGDFRLIGVQEYKVTYGISTSENTSLTALLAVNGDLTISAAQVYPTTGTSATISATGAVTFARSTSTLPDTPYSAGASLTVTGTDIVQGGVIRVPLGQLTFTATGALTLADGSVTSVSADGLSIPYGITTDGEEWYFEPTGGTALESLPEKALTLAGDSITVASGATVDISGGGDVTAYEFSAGTGGSRDVLLATNDDTYTSTTGCTYANCAQVYAIVPGLSDAAVAVYDPVYSSNYSSLSSVSGVGTRVQLDLGDGLQWYTLLPAQYATLSGGMLVVVRGTTTQAAGATTTLADGTVLATGVFGNTLSGSSGSTVYTFAVQSESVYSKYSSITLTSGNDYFTDLAEENDTTVPRLALDAGKLVLDAGTRLVVDAVLTTAAASGGRGAQVDIGGDVIAIVSDLPADTTGVLYITAGSITNLNAESVLIGATRTDADDGTTTLDVSASSITVATDSGHVISAPEIILAATGSITIADGAVIRASGAMNDEREGAYVLGDSTSSGTGTLVRVANGPERLTSRTTYTSAATLSVGAATLSGTSILFDSSGTISLADALVLEDATSVALAAGRIGLGITDSSYDGVVLTDAMRAVLSQTGGQLTLRSQSTIDFADGTYSFGEVRLDAATLAGTGGGAVVIAADTVTLSNAGGTGVVCTSCAANAGSLTIAADTILFSGGALATQATTTTAATTATLTYDVTVTLPAGTTVVSGSYTVTLSSDATIVIPAGTEVSLAAGSAVIGVSSTTGSVAAGTEITTSGISYTLASGTSYSTSTGVKYTLVANAVVTLPAGAGLTLADAVAAGSTDFFAGGVTLSASQGIYVTGQGAGLDAGSAALTLHTPYLGDRASTAAAGDSVIPDLTLATTGALVIDTTGAASLDLSSLGGVAGTAVTLTGGSVSITGTTVHASAGTLSIIADGSIVLGDGAVVEAPGLTTTYGDDTDGTTANSAGGTVNLTATNGDIDLGAGSTVSVANDGGDAGRLALSAVAGGVTFSGTIDGSAASDSTGGTFALETGGAVDLVALNTQVAAHGFTGGFEVESHQGDLTLAAGETLTSGAVTLIADGGFVIIAGTIDTSGANGGDISLYGNRGVTLAATAVLDAHADGYDDTDTRQASAGTITLGTDFVTGTTSTDADGMVSGTSGVITVTSGATLNLAATRTTARLVALSSGTGYTYVDADEAGTLVIRAPVVTGADGNPTVMVTVESADSVQGAAGVEVEAFTRWDLATVAASGSFSGVTVDAGGNVTLDVSDGLDTLSYDSATKTLSVTDDGGGLNFLGDIDTTGSHATVVGVIRDFDLSAATTGSGGLAALASAYGDDFTAAPGIDLAATGDITLASNWNLAAGVVDTTAALAAGVMGSESYNGTTVNYVVSGSEAELLERYTALLYRVGGSLTGAAPVLTLRAGGDLVINGIINDGFFSFADSSNETYLLSQTGVAGSYVITFGGGCATGGGLVNSANGFYLSLWSATENFNSYTTYTTTTTVTADPLDDVPYSADANSAAPPQTRNSFESMELFPTLDGDVQIDSASYRLVAGAQVGRDAGGGLTSGSDPMGLDPTSSGSVDLNGYSYTTTSGGGLTVEVTYTTLNSIVVKTKYHVSSPFAEWVSAEDWLSSTLSNSGYSQDYTGKALYYGTIPATYCKMGNSTCVGGTGNGTVLVTGNSTTGYNKVDSLSDLVFVVLSINSSDVGLTLNAAVDGNDGWTTASFRDYVKSGADSYLYSLYYSNATTPTADGDYFTVVYANGTGKSNPYVSSSTSLALLVSVKTLNYILTEYIAPLFPATTGAATTTTTLVPAMVRTGTGDIGIAAAGNVTLSGTNGAASVYTTGRAAIGAEVGTTSATVIATDGTTTGTATVDLGAYLGSKGFYLVDGGDIVIKALGSVRGDSETMRIAADTTTNWLTSDSTLDTGVGIDVNQEVLPTNFVGGVGTLAGGTVSVSAGRDLDDVGAVATSAIRTVAVTLADGTSAYAVDYLGESNLTLRAGRDILGGSGWVTSGSVTIDAGRDIASSGWYYKGELTSGPEFLTSVRILNATAEVTAGGDAELYFDQAIKWTSDSGWGLSWYADIATLAVIANGDLAVSFTSSPGKYTTLTGISLAPLPGSVSLVAVAGDLDFLQYDSSGIAGVIMLPSDDGQLVLLAGGDIGAVTWVMDDADPANMPGPFATVIGDGYTARGLIFPVVTSATSEGVLRLYHNEDLTHVDDDLPVYVMAGGDIDDMTLVTPKQTRVVAGGDIVNMVFFGQNLHATDVTRIAAAGDVTATSTITVARYLTDSGSWGTESAGEATLQGNLFVIGGPGSFFLEAGGDIGPFLNSATIYATTETVDDAATYTYAGGVLSVGYDWNPWLKDVVVAAGGGASLYVLFGLGAAGPDYAGFADTYVNPANAAALSYGGYAATLVEWIEDRYGLGGLSETEAYALFLTLPAVDQHVFLLSKVYVNELEQVAVTTSESYQVYSRGYAAVNTLFPAANGYTENSLEGGAVETARVHTGDLDLRLATLQTTRGGDIYLFGPGGDILAGSVVRTSTQASKRNYTPAIYRGGGYVQYFSVDSIPTAYEGILTLRGGAIFTFTDGSLILNQSRLFTENGGDIVAWSSNGDLNAGQGAKTSTSFTPIVVTYDWTLYGEVDPAGSVMGAGIAAFQPEIGEESPDVYLLAPRGTVDAGDAGIRVAGDISIVAYQVRNADNIQVAGTTFGVPAAVGVGTDSVLGASDTAAQAAGAAEDAARATRQPGPRVADLPSIILFEVLGYGGDGAPGQDDPSADRDRRRPGDISYDPNAAVRVVGLGRE